MTAAAGRGVGIGVEVAEHGRVVLGLFVEVGALFAGRGPPHEGVVGEGGPGEGLDEGLVRGRGGVVEGFVGVFDFEGEEGGLIVVGGGVEGVVVVVAGACAVGGGVAAAGEGFSEGLSEGTVAA